MTNRNKGEETLKTYTPVIIFIISTFFLEQFGLAKSTNLIISVFLSLVSFMVKVAMLKEQYGEYSERKILTLHTGILSLMFIIIFANGFLHWYKIWHVDLRWTIFFILLLIYFILLSRAVHVLKAIKIKLESEEKKGGK
ncbi:hypothetical protein ACFLSX_00490 [Calditrichota bacterium]